MASIHELNLHESVIMDGLKIVRVPGGWLYRFWTENEDNNYIIYPATFVPYDLEFREATKGKKQ